MENHAEDQAKAQVESIVELVKAYEEADSGELVEYEGEQLNREQLEERIQETPLSIQVRGGWYTPGQGLVGDSETPEEYELLLCTGGPACRMIGELDKYGQPETVRVEYQDWGTLWTEYPYTLAERDSLLTFARAFYYGEGR